MSNEVIQEQLLNAESLLVQVGRKLGKKEGDEDLKGLVGQALKAIEGARQMLNSH